MVNPRNCLRCRHQRCAASFPVSVSALCANQPLLFKKKTRFATKVHQHEWWQGTWCNWSLCLFACSEIAPCLCCDIRCRVWLEVFQNACVLPRTFFPPLNVFDSSCPCERTGLPGSERHATLAHRPRVEPRTKSGRGATLQEHPTTLAIPRQQS